MYPCTEYEYLKHCCRTIIVHEYVRVHSQHRKLKSGVPLYLCVCLLAICLSNKEHRSTIMPLLLLVLLLVPQTTRTLLYHMRQQGGGVA